LFIIHVNDPPQRINAVSDAILFADDTSVIISVRNFRYFCLVSYSLLSHVIKWFAAIKLVLNLDKTDVIKFLTKNSSHSTFHTCYKEKCKEETINTKFLGLHKLIPT